MGKTRGALLLLAVCLAFCAGCSSESFEPGIVYTRNRVVGDELVVAELWLADAATGRQQKVRDIREDFLGLRPAGPGRMSIYFSSGELHVLRLADGRMELAAKPAAPAGMWRDFRLASPDFSRLAVVEILEGDEALWCLDTESGRGVKVAQPYYGLSGMHWNRNRPGTFYFAAHDEGQDSITKVDCADSGKTEILFTSEARTISFRFSDDEQTLAVC